MLLFFFSPGAKGEEQAIPAAWLSSSPGGLSAFAPVFPEARPSPIPSVTVFMPENPATAAPSPLSLPKEADGRYAAGLRLAGSATALSLPRALPRLSLPIVHPAASVPWNPASLGNAPPPRILNKDSSRPPCLDLPRERAAPDSPFGGGPSLAATGTPPFRPVVTALRPTSPDAFRFTGGSVASPGFSGRMTLPAGLAAVAGSTASITLANDLRECPAVQSWRGGGLLVAHLQQHAPPEKAAPDVAAEAMALCLATARHATDRELRTRALAAARAYERRFRPQASLPDFVARTERNAGVALDAAARLRLAEQALDAGRAADAWALARPLHEDAGLLPEEAERLSLLLGLAGMKRRKAEAGAFLEALAARSENKDIRHAAAFALAWQALLAGHEAEAWEAMERLLEDEPSMALSRRIWNVKGRFAQSLDRKAGTAEDNRILPRPEPPSHDIDVF